MGSGGVAIAALPTVICLKVPFSDGLGALLYAVGCSTYSVAQVNESAAYLFFCKYTLFK